MRAQGANRHRRPLRATVVIGFSSRRSEPMRHHRVVPIAVGGESSSLLRKSGSRILVEVDVVLPDSPDDAGEFVGESDGGLVVTAQALDLKGPGA